MSMRTLTLATVVAVLLSSSVWAQSVASKVSYQGTPRHLSVSGLKVRDNNGMLNLAIEISNSDNSDQTGYYRLQWVDAAGFPAWSEEPWKPVLLHGGQRSTVLVIAPTMQARDFTIEFSDDSNWSAGSGPSDQVR